MSYINQKPFQFWLFISLLFLAFIWLFKGIMMPFVVGIAIAYLLNPVVESMERRKFPRWLSSLMLLSVFFVTLLVGLLIAVPVLIREMVDFIQLLPTLFAKAQTWIADTLPMIDMPANMDDVKNMDTTALSEKMGGILSVSKGILGNILQGGLAVIGFISFLVLVPIVSFYLMVDWPRLVSKINDLVPNQNKKRIHTIFTDIDKSLSGFIRGQLTVCFLLGGFYAIALSLIGLEYGFFIGVAAGVLSLIPYIGSLFGLVASVGMAFYQFGGWEYPAIALAIFIVGQLVEGNYLTPKLVGGSVGLHPLWVIFVLMAGGALLGLLGMMIAVPVAAVIGVLVRHAIINYKDSSYYKGKNPAGKGGKKA